MTEWSDRVEQLLFDGERVQERLSVGASTVHVTSHRVLVFRSADGANFRAVDRPNATGAARATVSDRNLLPAAIRVGVVAAILLVAGVAFAPERLLPMPDLGTDGPASDVLGPIETMLRLFYALDDVMLVGGVVAAVVAVALFGYQVATRRSVIVVSVAGDDDLWLPADGVDDAAVERLDAALGPPEPGESGGGSEPAGTDAVADSPDIGD